MKISLQIELSQQMEKSVIQKTPQINENSKKIAQKKLLETTLQNAGEEVQTEVYNRLYQIGKKRQHQRNETEPGGFQTYGSQNSGTKMIDTQMIQQSARGPYRVVDLTFKPQIHKKSQNIKRDKPIQQHLYEDFIER